MKENGNEKKCMIFDFIDYLQENNAGWVEKDVVESLGQEFVKYVTEAIWYIDIKIQKKRPDFDKDILNEYIGNLIPYKEAK
uniref:Uncharacterized protein n=1 Tax=Rhizophagus irregularis (strain DAOM 181602 / DAOM 197198 / MUCL 43194) TaxID=747089 RepID=U9UHK3_RHIID